MNESNRASDFSQPEIGRTYEFDEPVKATAWPSTDPPTFNFGEPIEKIGVADFSRGKYLGQDSKGNLVFEGRALFNGITLCLFRACCSNHGVIGRHE